MNSIACLLAVAILPIWLVSGNPVQSVPTDTGSNRFRQAVNRTYLGFEKENNSNWQDDFYFIQGADPQLGLIEVFRCWFGCPNGTDGNWKRDLQLVREAVKQWNQMKPPPKFVTICGDLVNQIPQENETVRRAQLDDLKQALLQLNPSIPLVLMGGNHDFLNNPNRQSVDTYRQEFGDDYYSFWVGGVMFIVLNSQYYKNHSQVGDEYAQQNRWLDQQLLDAKQGNYSHVIVLQHIPWFLHNIDEPVDPMFTIAVEERKRMVDKLYDANVRYIFAGHYHRNAEGKYRALDMVTTSAIGAQSFEGKNAESGYRVVNVTRNAVSHQYRNIESNSTVL